MRNLRYIDGVASLRLDTDRCVGCGQCAVVCPHGVFALDTGRARIVDPDGCMECGACAVNCPTRAVSVAPGVGCAAAIINSWIKGGPPDCDCGGTDCC